MNWGWVVKMAWRDSRRNRSRLFLFISSIILGIASLVAIKSFNKNLNHNIEEQAAQLLGADLVLEINKTPDEAIIQLLDSIGGLSLEQSEEQQFMSMVLFNKTEGTRFIQVRAFKGDFPFYGSLETSPKEVNKLPANQKVALVDHNLMVQFDAVPGDTLQLGASKFTILGGLLSQPGQSAVSGAFAPAIMIPLDQLEETGLLQVGSRIEYKHYYKFSVGFPVDEMVKQLEDQFRFHRLQVETIESNKQDVGRSFTDMAEFMGLVGFIALLLGCIGVSSAVHVFVQEKLVSVAILRCLGASSTQTFFIFLVQFAGIGLIGGAIGAMLGGMIQYFIPLIMESFIPFKISNFISWNAVLEGIGVGLVISLLFALLPLIAVRHVSPLQTLRVSESTTAPKWDILKIIIYLAIGSFVILFTYVQLGDWMKTMVFGFAVLLIFLLFFGVSKLLIWAVRKYFPARLSFVWRQGLANLYRPRNQTVVLLISIGLGTSMVATLWFVQDMLVQRVNIASQETQANMLLFDIQTSQIEAIKEQTTAAGFPIIDEVPIVTVQLTHIKGKSAEELLTDSTDRNGARAVNREIRATYRSALSSSEKIVSGDWVSKVEPDEPASVSLEVGYANRMGVKVGDELTFDVFGVTVPARVTSLREVNWNQFSTNFRIVFSAGTLDNAPKFFVLMTKIDEESALIPFQQSIVKNYPNVSVIDVDSVMSVLSEIMSKIAFVIQFLGGFSILTGLIVLVASIRISKYQRIRDNVLLRTLGANRRQVLFINASEYFILGLLAALVGLLVSVGVTTLLGVFVFEFTFIPSAWMLLGIFLFVALLTTVIGVLNSLVALNRPPLEVLRRT